MNNIYPTIATIATVSNVYTDIVTAVVADTDIDDTTETETETVTVAVADSVCINIYDNTTDSILLTNDVVSGIHGNYKCCYFCIIVASIIGLFIVVGTFVLISI